MYDDSKLKKAVKAWFAENITQGFGLVYSGALLDDFNAWCENNSHGLKSSPGRVAFGKQLTAIGVEKKVSHGLMCYVGIKLNNPPADDAIERRRQERSIQAQRQRQAEAEAERARRLLREDDERRAQAAQVKARMRQESQEQVEAVAIQESQ